MPLIPSLKSSTALGMQDTESGLGDAATSVSSTAAPSSPISRGLALSAEAIVGLLIGILLSLVLTLAVVVIVLCLVKRRQTTATKDKPLHGIGKVRMLFLVRKPFDTLRIHFKVA